MSTQPQATTDDDALIRPAVFEKYSDRLAPEHNLFECNRCGHYAGDTRPRNFLARCPGCERIVKFYRIIS